MAALAVMISCSLIGVTAMAGQAEGMPGTDSTDVGEEIVGTDSTDAGKEIEGTDGTDAGEEIEGTDSTDAGEEAEGTDGLDAVEGMSGSDEQGAAAEGLSGVDNQDTVPEKPDADSTEEVPNTDKQDVLTDAPDADSKDTEDKTGSKKADIVSLQIPQKLGVVIDPWEIAGKGQIYSEPYTIQNTGEETGILTLSFSCRKGEGSTAVIRTDTAGLHDDENKSIYIEMTFGDAERIILTEEGLEYQAELQPGEELSVSFAGEVNEYASDGWGDADLEIEGVYFWNVVEGADAVSESDVEEPEEALTSEAEDAEGTEGKNAADGNVLPGNDSAEGTDSSAAAEPAEGSDGQDGDVKEGSESEPQDGEEQNGSSDSKDAPDGNRTEETDASQSGTEPAEPAGGEESGSLSGGEDGETEPEESEGVSAPKDIGGKDGAEINPDGGEDSLFMEDVGGEAEPGLEDAPGTLPGNAEEASQQETEDADITGTDSQETGRNPEMDDEEDGWEG